MSARTVWVKLVCCAALGMPPNAWVTAGLLYQAWGAAEVNVLASAYGALPKLTNAVTGAADVATGFEATGAVTTAAGAMPVTGR